VNHKLQVFKFLISAITALFPGPSISIWGCWWLYSSQHSYTECTSTRGRVCRGYKFPTGLSEVYLWFGWRTSTDDTRSGSTRCSSR